MMLLFVFSFYAMANKGVLQLFKSFAQEAVTSFKSLSPSYPGFDISPAEYGGTNMMWLFGAGANGCDIAFDYQDLSSSLKAYRDCPPVASIINKKASCIINGKPFIMNTQGKAKGKESQSIQGTQLRNIFNNPNSLQSGKQFKAQGYAYMQIFGFNLVLAVKPAGFKDNIDATALWNIPPFMVDIETTKKLFYQTDKKNVISHIRISWEGQITDIPVEDVLIMGDITPCFESMIFPESRIRAIRKPIANIIGAYESRQELINYRGARGIFSSAGKDSIGNVPVTPKEKEDLHNQFRQQYGLRAGQRQFIISSAAFQWQQIGQSTAELMLFEEVEGSTMAVCDAYMYPYALISSDKQNNLGGSNVDPNMRILYQDAIIPESDSIDEQWNTFFDTAKYGISITSDFSHVACLQQDEQKKATARKTMGDEVRAEFFCNLITYNRCLELLGEDTRTGWDKYYYELLQEGITFTFKNTSNGNNSNEA